MMTPQGYPCQSLVEGKGMLMLKRSGMLKARGVIKGRGCREDVERKGHIIT